MISVILELQDEELSKLGLVAPKDPFKRDVINQLRALLGLKPKRYEERKEKSHLCKFCGENPSVTRRPPSNIMNGACNVCFSCLPNHDNVKHLVFAQNNRAGVSQSTLTPFIWVKMLLDSKGRCSYCQQDVGYTNLVMEHKTPVSRGGYTTPENVTPSCRACNKSKGRKLLHEWKPEIYGNQIQPEPGRPTPPSVNSEGI